MKEGCGFPLRILEGGAGGERVKGMGKEARICCEHDIFAELWTKISKGM